VIHDTYNVTYVIKGIQTSCSVGDEHNLDMDVSLKTKACNKEGDDYNIMRRPGVYILENYRKEH
jgi:hypothetical protein